MRVMICGGTGFIGTALSQALQERGDEVCIVTRRPPAASAAGFLYVTWEEWSANPNLWRGVDAIVNLAGETVGQRWTEEAKRSILVSRTQTALHLADIVRRMDEPPKVLVNGSGISLYGHSTSPIMKRKKKRAGPKSRVKPASELLEEERDESAVTADAAGIRGFTPQAGGFPPRGNRNAAEALRDDRWHTVGGDRAEELSDEYDDFRGFDLEEASFSEGDSLYGTSDEYSTDRRPYAPEDSEESYSYGAGDSDIAAEPDYGWFDEYSPAHPEDHLGRVVVAWEEAVNQIPIERIVKLRISLVLARKGGSFPLLRLPYRLFAGGRLGKGTQGLPWIHLHDMISLILFSLDRPDVSGPINAVAPDPVNNDQFGRTLGRVMRRGHWFHVPEWLLRRVLGEQSAMVLTGQHAYPRRALERGFVFAYPHLEDALRDITGRKS